MEVSVIEIQKLKQNMSNISKQLRYISKQIDRNKIKYPIGMTYDQMAVNIFNIVGKDDAKREFKIVRIT